MKIRLVIITWSECLCRTAYCAQNRSVKAFNFAKRSTHFKMTD